MRAVFACLVALLVGLSALQPACAHVPAVATGHTMHHGSMERHAPAKCDHDALATCLGCGLAAAPTPADALSAPFGAKTDQPGALAAAACVTSAPELADPPPRLPA